MHDLMVKRRRYLTDAELWELHALCAMLPGPSSTQTITAIGYKLGGPTLAFLTLLIWLLPATIIMTALGLAYAYLETAGISLGFLRFMGPAAVGFVAFAGYRIARAVCHTNTQWAMMGCTAVVSLLASSPYTFPALLLLGAAVTNFETAPKPLKIKWPRLRRARLGWRVWGNLFLWLGIFFLAAFLGGITNSKLILLFENCYRYGSLVFGGGQVLVPMLHEQFVDFKGYLTNDEFLTGYGLAQAVPGPVFSFTAFVGALSMRELGGGGVFEMLMGAGVASAAIYLPGTLLIFFLVPLWAKIRDRPFVKNALAGVNAVSAGLVVAAALTLMPATMRSNVDLSLAAAVFVALQFTKISPPYIVAAALSLGVVVELVNFYG